MKRGNHGFSSVGSFPATATTCSARLSLPLPSKFYCQKDLPLVIPYPHESQMVLRVARR